MRTFIRLFMAALIVGAPLEGFARSASGHLSGNGYVDPSSHYTHGYYRHDGSYVHGSSPLTGGEGTTKKFEINPMHYRRKTGCAAAQGPRHGKEGRSAIISSTTYYFGIRSNTTLF